MDILRKILAGIIAQAIGLDPRRKRWGLRPFGVVLILVTVLVVGGGMAWGVSQVLQGLSVRPVRGDLEERGAGKETPTPPPGGDVEQQFLEAWRWAFVPDVPHNPADAELYFAPLPEDSGGDWVFAPSETYWYGWDRLQEELAREREKGFLYRVLQEGGEWDIKVLRTAPGRVVLKAHYTGTCSVQVRVIMGEEIKTQDFPTPCWEYLVGMVCDGERCRIASLRLYRPGMMPQNP